jgi:hypothetical protein
VQKWKVFERETFFQTFFSSEVFNSFATCFQNVQRTFFHRVKSCKKLSFFKHEPLPMKLFSSISRKFKKKIQENDGFQNKSFSEFVRHFFGLKRN